MLTMLIPLKTIIWAFAMSCFLQRLSEIHVARKPTSGIFNSRFKLKHRQICMPLRVTLNVPSVRASISKRQLARRKANVPFRENSRKNLSSSSPLPPRLHHHIRYKQLLLPKDAKRSITNLQRKQQKNQIGVLLLRYLLKCLTFTAPFRTTAYTF